MVDKAYCMSSFLAFRYIERADMDFYEGMHHKLIEPVPDENKVLVKTAKEIDAAIQDVFSSLRGQRLGLMFSASTDSSKLAS